MASEIRRLRHRNASSPRDLVGRPNAESTQGGELAAAQSAKSQGPETTSVSFPLMILMFSRRYPGLLSGPPRKTTWIISLPLTGVLKWGASRTNHPRVKPAAR